MFTKIENNPKKSLYLFGLILSLAFAPTFFVPALLSLGVLGYFIKNADSRNEAFIYGFWFGFGFFTSSLYWISLGVSVYITDFWWAIPFALFGLPFFLAFFIAFSSMLSWRFRSSPYYTLYLSLIWVGFEWLRSWLFTGLPWNLLGYSLAFSNELIQIGSVFGIYGMSLIVAFISFNAIHLFSPLRFKYYLTSSLIIIAVFTFGEWRLNNNPTIFSSVKLRLVQPNIAQSEKWDEDLFWSNLRSHVNMSVIDTGFVPDIILWSEAAVTAPYDYSAIRQLLQSAIIYPNTVLITGGVNQTMTATGEPHLYTSAYAINQSSNVLFNYNKAHLVPFGEYIPLRSFFPLLKKLTPGLLDYSAGKGGEIVTLPQFNLKIRPLICYEAIFPRESITKNADVIINLTNDSWYGYSTGPYQHFHMARMRAVENGLPFVRVAGSGISAIIDPLGRIIAQTPLLHATTLDGILPVKLSKPTIYVVMQELGIVILSGILYLISLALRPKD